MRYCSATLHFLTANLAADAADIVPAGELLEGYVLELLLSNRDVVYHYLANSVIIPLPWHSVLQFLALCVIPLLDRMLQRNT